ncbi:site-specific DNA-methyltransferase [Streptococcus equi]|uniref:site-specific DNA-methyltransferase n=1 Tax=Streptococcus equi TaxID=1336 RepID=UPI0006591432|nr:site-specific DNA-methyltransferase [Streptococcus equi]CRQ91100.1 phage DNA methylase [Streptococcus equi subsp. equi]HEL0922189.1 site-specific DNA-methyltransferase [Streptococcus equi subsp. equi]HEL0932799.1 site-specific DNA-methyltransferase [Streptococcus equi subsp. equi]HEL0957809.1 site-specific DNA-methyltransferase [Streptococcus equi subsp. equi]HEL1468993.1 site-specific DNA-methyltransferase [Streptococcus equi subsp. equi]
MQIQKVSISEIKMYENNAKLHPKKQIEQIKSSIKAFGNNDPIAIDESNIIIEGHGRYTALKELGYDEVDVIKLTHLTEEQKKAYILAHNKLTMNTGFDIDILTEELQSIMDIDMSVFGFDVDLAAAFEEIDKELDDFDNTLPAEPKSKFGQIYQLGRHRLMCGDGTNQSDVKKLMGGELADLLITDPPYNVAYQGKTKDALTIQNDDMDSNAFRQFLREAFKAADSVIKPGAVFYIWHADSEGYNFRGACLDVGWTVRQCLIWNKNAMVLGRQDYHWKHEPCLYGWKDGASHLWASDRKQTTVIDFDKPQRNGDHPTMKPVGLFDYQIKNNTKGHDIVLDLFGGSGTTLIACESNGRCARLMECDPKYVDVIIKRWEELTGESVIQLN